MAFRSTVYVVEDDYEYRKKIILSLKNYHSNFVQFNVSSIDNHLFFMEELQSLSIADTDIFIFDIDLKTTFTGIDLALEVRKHNRNCSIIFLTSLEDQAIPIINSNILPIGYLIKNTVSSIKLSQPLYELLDKIEDNLNNSWREDPNIVMIKTGAKKIYVNGKDILYIESMKGLRGKILIKTFHEDIIINGQIGKIKKLVEHQPYLFTSLQSYIINLTSITVLDRAKGMIIFSSGDELLVGIKIIDKLKKVL
ncbi:hypothetical protein UAW_03007 [Enterococcus haemoperoxidus ATCC BAA-382]|uniref:HTH LytTR-type domain-containing protein n=1 Tax=Enterococcus haemoperoxidus ATCC BAA-382 TaxID=1158608 RepID=R2Q7L3_9ENTE|nr:LytTR family transcriptional regulator DNA-binding domain-containing protein [Enterococcus haemoperoxidus]EOH92487.1 hypothetical protein UAW_03007 [Enterococcus haemoperoxidus ATCC BAA-382]EOT61708.1 hypothetical protein I583_00690 [Enterococcus haemoperoxidus ATCC BAA-382]OJG51826.1 hypothetical protein RV06_GL001518 [Enterococcus haemoperoxidus]